MAFEVSIQFMQDYVKCSIKYIYFQRMRVVFNWRFLQLRPNFP